MAELKTEKNYFVKSIGYAPTGSGSLRAKTFYLGAVADGVRAAQRMADRIGDAWAELKATGATAWTPEALAAIKGEVKPAVTGVVIRNAGSPLTIKEIGTLYADYLDARAAKGQIGVNTVAVEKIRIAKAVEIVGKNIQMNQLDETKLLASVLTLASRPMNKQHAKSKAEPTRMSFTSAKEYIKSYKTFLTWTSSTPIPGTLDRPLWIRPLRFEQVFRDNRPVMLEEERAAELERIEAGTAEVPTFSMAELVELYKAAKSNAVKYGQLFMLLALNLGFANEEIADLKRNEIKFGKEPFIHRFRGKTEKPNDFGVYAKWPLWDETTKLLQEMMAPEGLNALVTPDGRRLVVGRTDFVKTTWDIVQKRVDANKRDAVHDYSFKYLRKTASTMIQNDIKHDDKNGEKIADAFLSHGGRGVLGKYTSRDWEGVAKAVAALRVHLEPMFAAK